MPTPVTRALLLALTLAFAPLTPALAQSPTASDLQALRFYLDQGNDMAVNAELRRLQIEFPEWVPPADMDQLFAQDGPVSIDRIYRLIEARDFSAARALIAETDREFPQWSPPADLLDLLSVSEGQAAFSTAVAAGQAETAIGIVRGIPALLSCERVNNAWELADMHLLRGDTAQALGVYRAVTQSCTEEQVLVATLEKADMIASLTDLESLSDTAQAQNAAAVAALRQAEDRLRAGRQAAPRWGTDEQMIALDPGVAETLPPAPTQTQRPPPPPTPQTGTQSGTQTAPVAAPGPGAQAAATTAPATAPAAGGSAVERAAQRGAWAECLALSAGSSNVNVVFQRGWCAYNADRAMEAVSAFQSAAQRSGSASIRRDAHYGWMLSLLKLNMTEQAAQLAAQVDLTRTQRVEIEGQILDQRGVRAYENGDYARAAAFFAAHEDLTGVLRRDLALLRGYALLNQGKTHEARGIFMTLHRQLATRETRAALSAAQE